MVDIFNQLNCSCIYWSNNPKKFGKWLQIYNSLLHRIWRIINVYFSHEGIVND